jgi:serine/threonine protein kinase
VARYTFEATTVGQGGQGKVHKGVDNDLGRKVAVKSLDPMWVKAGPDEKERFRREARTLAKLSHPNVPAIYDVEFEEDTFRIIFQYVEGTNLRDLFADDEPIPLAECRAWFDQVASALQHAHTNGIVHRDVKPENMIVSLDRKHCYLVDFGICFSQHDDVRLTPSDEWIGTPGYMSPEQERGEKPNPIDDVYSLGVTLYEALCGHKIKLGEYQTLTAQSELIPPAIDSLIQKCIAEPPRRMKSAEEFRTLLKSALQGHGSLSEVLRAGQLHEVVGALGEMTPTQFMDLKAGQRLLILQKCKDVVADDDPRLAMARVQLLSAVTLVGIYLKSTDYKEVADPAIRLSYGAPDDRGIYSRGSMVVRESLIDAASQVGTDNHHVIVESLLSWLMDINLPVQKTGFFHGLRLLLNALLANTECGEADAEKLAKILANINELHRQKAHDGDKLFPAVYREATVRT